MTIELIKYVLNPKRPLSDYRNHIVNLRFNIFNIQQLREVLPIDVKEKERMLGCRITMPDSGMNCWSKVEMPKDMKLEDFSDFVKEKYNDLLRRTGDFRGSGAI